MHCDPFREGIWIFQNAPNASFTREAGFPGAAEIQRHGLLQKESGTYEPASLAKSKPTTSVSINTPTNTSSPSSSFDGSARSAHNLNARSVQTNGTVSLQEPSTPSPSPSTPKEIHEHFISAILGSIVYFVSRDHGFIPLNSRTLVSNQSASRPFEGVEIVTLDISLTSLGALVVKGYSDIVTGLQRAIDTSSSQIMLHGLNPGAPMWIAPSGNAAKFYSRLDDNASGDSRSPRIQENSHQYPANFSPSAIKSWQVKCLDWLSSRGLNPATIDGGGWVFVQIQSGHLPSSSDMSQIIPMPEQSTIVPWPAVLCFRSASPASKTLLEEGSPSPRDPLLFAEDWFNAKDERAKLIARRQKDKFAAESLSNEQADIEARAISSNIYSPVALRRSSNAGAMYPTPPDAPQPPIGATPSMNGDVSTPGNTITFAPPEAGMTNASNITGVDMDVEMWDSSGKKGRTSSDVNFNETDNDNLFNSIGGDLFGNEDITDADFSFFDEPDDMQVDPKSSPPAPPAFPADQESAENVHDFVSPSAKKDITEPPTPAMPIPKEEDLEGPPAYAPISTDPVIQEQAQATGTSEDTKSETPSQQIDYPSLTEPFSKEIVFKRLLEQSASMSSNKSLRRTSLFNKVDFPDSLLSVRQKYGVNGSFNFSTKERRLEQTQLNELPQTEYLRNKRKLHQDGHEFGTLARLLMDKEPTNLVSDESMDYLPEGGSQGSEQDDTSHTTNESTSTQRNSLKRKWENNDGGEVSSSLDSLAMDFEHVVGTPKSLIGPHFPVLEADPADWSLASYVSLPTSKGLSSVLPDVDFLATAQILTDQIGSGTLQFANTTASGVSCLMQKTCATRKLMHSLIVATKSCMKGAVACTVRSLLDIQGLPVLNHGLRLPARPGGNPRGPIPDAIRPNNPFPIPPPQLELRRSDSKLSLLPAAVPFWENLGLGPSTGTKDVISICLHPNWEGVSANASIFLDQMRSIYESSRFGSHERPVCKELPTGLVSYPPDLPLASLCNITGRLGKLLSSLNVDGKNFVVYFICPSEDTLVHACSAFRHLFNTYRKDMLEKRKQTVNELVLQLIPLDFVASPISFSVAQPSEDFRLAMEVYDRCMDFNSSSSTPAIMLEQPLPRSIDFKLNATPSASVLQENTCLHVAYAQSIDDRWITAAWTDNKGTQQMTASYCLSRKNEPISRPFSDIAHEIWETTLDYISSKRIHWRLMIARVGVMDPSELDFWTSLASTESNAQVSLTLITVQTNPSLRLLPIPATLSQNGPSPNSVITPVSTPQASQPTILSPDNASTPSQSAPTAGTPIDTPTEPDPSARLLDATDQSWGAILSHRLNNSNSLLETNLALISGYLIKRGGTNADDAPVVLEVNIVFSEVVGNPRTFHENLLREVLGYYRGLGTVARIRGVVDAVKDIRPWHVAVVEKAVKALYMLM